MFMIDEGKNLVRDKLYDFFMEPFNEGDCQNINDVTSINFDVGESIDIYSNGDFGTNFAHSITVPTLTVSSEYLIRTASQGSVTFTANLENTNIGRHNLSGVYIANFSDNTTSTSSYFYIGLVVDRFNSTNSNIYYYPYCFWRILRIA